MNVLDTYALIEICKGHQKYSLILNQDFLIAETTMAEFYGVLLREYNEATANYWLKKFQSYVTEINLEVFIEAIKYRHKHKKQKLSFFDCVGYCYSIKNNYIFVTGDKEFKNKEKVKFIH